MNEELTIVNPKVLAGGHQALAGGHMADGQPSRGPKSELAVACREVRKSFGEGEAAIEVLRGVDFEAVRGKLTFLVGPSGCGKTTLISVIAGLLDKGAGKVELFGQDLEELSPRERILFRRQNLGFVYQQFNLLPALTAAENVAVPLLVAGMGRSKAMDRARALLVKLGLEHRLDAVPEKLSGGQQQRVTLARALVHEPRLIICDEPTAALDHATGEAVMGLLSENAVHPERAVIVVTHDNRVFHFADAIAHMDDGRIVGVSSGREKEQAPNKALAGGHQSPGGRPPNIKHQTSDFAES
jgi:putative ABC transport system ATP-binding protein